MRFAEPAAAFALACLAAAPVRGAETVAVNFSLSAGRLSDALIQLAEQARITIDSGDPGLASRRVGALRGRMTAEAALTRLLAGSGYRFVFVTPRAVRIVRAPAPTAAPAPAPPPRPLPSALPQPDIVVTASKQQVPLGRFPGTVHLVDPDEGGTPARFGARGSDVILDRLPMLASTSLGPGRDKIFIRGVADSSFNGPSQSIVGQYLGDVRLTFNAPDPDLSLYDVSRVELLEGPQGALYGSGSLGGIIRIVPNTPELDQVAAAFSAGLLATAHGAAGVDGSAMLNLPIVPGRLALRALAYGASDGGYIDDPARADVNRTTNSGGRAALLWSPGDGWQAELSGIAQYLNGRDGQYATRGLAPLTRATALPQPFDNDYLLGALTLRRSWRDLELVSTSQWIDHALDARFDATGAAGTVGTQLYDEDVAIHLLANETRLARTDPDGAGWLIGWSLVHDTSRIRRSLGPPGAPQPIAGIGNEDVEAALFGTFGVHFGPSIVATFGGRLTYAHSSGRTLDTGPDPVEPNRTDWHLTPTLALGWRPGGAWLVYARLSQGFRAGGIAVSGSGAAIQAQRFESDSLTAYEAGVRLGRPDRDRLSFNASISYARWADIQADLIDARGLPFTTNLGNGRIYGIEAEARWRPLPALSLEAAAFINESALANPVPAFATSEERDLPNIAGAGGRLAAHGRFALSPRATLSLDAALRYVGHSQLGIGPPLEQSQGGYVDGQVGGRLDFGRFGVTLDVDNVADARHNRFSYGNPFALAAGTEITPLRPRTVRLGLDARF